MLDGVHEWALSLENLLNNNKDKSSNYKCFTTLGKSNYHNLYTKYLSKPIYLMPNISIKSSACKQLTKCNRFSKYIYLL